MHQLGTYLSECSIAGESFKVDAEVEPDGTGMREGAAAAAEVLGAAT